MPEPTDLVITVHQPDHIADILLSSRSHHLAPGPVHRPHDLRGARSLWELHALPAHDEGLAHVALLGGEYKVPGRDQSTTTVSSHLDERYQERCQE